MASNWIQYRRTLLLLWAALAMATNPVWHAIGHHIDCHDDERESVFLSEWTAQDLCPYCDGVSPFEKTKNAVNSPATLILQEKTPAFIHLYSGLRLHLSTRLRAPPLLVNHLPTI